MVQIEDKDNWRHLSERETEKILSGNAKCELKIWSNYHLKKKGHNCKKCKEKFKKKRSD